MRGNSHVRFLGGEGVVIPLTYPIAVAVAELAMQRFVRPPDAGSSPVSHLRMWCKRVFQVVKSKSVKFVIRFESGNQRVMNQKGETKNDNHYDH